MKKLLIILAVGLSLSVYSQQVTPTGTVLSLSVSQQSVCQCDSVDFSFIFREKPTFPSSVASFSVYARNASVYVLLKTFTHGDIKLMGTSPVGNQDTIYFSKMLIPCDLLSKLGVDFDYTASITFKDGSSEGLFVKNCLVGVDELLPDSATPIYYNFSGQIVEPKQGELLIKQVGNKRIKVLIR